MTSFMLVGNPNCGKTTLFNALTGSNQRVGNWPGVTVEQKTGWISLDKTAVSLTDLPGIYSLSTNRQELSQDELVATDVLLSLDDGCIVNVVDACHLERHLYLTSQLLELGKPLILVLNMMDRAKQQGIVIDVNALSRQLHCPVIPVQAHTALGLPDLLQCLKTPPAAPPPLNLSLSPALAKVIALLKSQLMTQGCSMVQASYQALRLAESNALNEYDISNVAMDAVDLDIGLADARYQKIHEIVGQVQQKQSDASNHFTAKADKILLHRIWALPIFLGLMYLMFFFAINVGGAFQDFFDQVTDTLFVQGSAWLLTQWHAPQWVVAILAYGVGKGLNTTFTFIPVIAGMFFFLALLETSGYMARAAFIVDKAMRFLGLPGKSFVPMIVGFGCNVPAIMAARTLDSERDRLLTVMMSPFMSCSARLAIYAVFVAAFFPTGGSAVVFSLYLIGILMAVLTGFLLRRFYLKGQASPLIVELPAYHKPSLQRLMKETVQRLRFFIVRAGKVIVPVCVLLGALNAITLQGGLNTNEADAHSLLAWLGQSITPLFAPMGISQDNWPATVGLLTGMLAKEVVIGTLNTLYVQTAHWNELAGTFDFWGNLLAALQSIPYNLAHLGEAIANPVAASAAMSEMNTSAYGIMAQRFHGASGAYAYLLFVLLYIPCVSTMAVIRQEANRKMMWLSVVWSLLIAYTVAVTFYQASMYLPQLMASLSAKEVLGACLLSSSLLFVFFKKSRK